jgi:uncharacterized LabA/DUF88 family protein
MSRRVAMYVDGFNLFHGMKQRHGKRYYWLDIAAIAQFCLDPGQALVAVHYFTSRIRASASNAPDRLRQNTYIDALTARGAQVHEGHFLAKSRRCNACSAMWESYEEKMTDVNIATELIVDAYNDRFDVAFLVSGDSDLTSPIQRIRSTFPNKQVVVLFPPARHSKQLQKTANGVLTLSEALLRKSQLPLTVTTASGYVLTRPQHWR